MTEIDFGATLSAVGTNVAFSGLKFLAKLRTLALAVLVTVPAAATADELKIPDRYNLPGVAGPPDKISPGVAKLGGAALLNILRDPKDERRIEAVLALVAKTNQSKRGEKKAYSWNPIADSVTAIDYLLVKGTPPIFRRWAVYHLFSVVSAEVRDRITLDPEDRKVDDWWERLDDLRVRGRRDVDPRLAEFFERYENDPAAPLWQEAKKDAVTARFRILAAHPEAKERLANIWQMQENIEKSQLTILSRLESHIDARVNIPAKRRARLKAICRSTMDHRQRIVWANMGPRIMIEDFGAVEAKAYGFEPVPIRLGWPQVPAR